MARRRILSGVVTTFDERTGLGQVTPDGGEPLEFHCTAIADGSRTIGVGLTVRFRVAPGSRGRWEAVAVERAER